MEQEYEQSQSISSKSFAYCFQMDLIKDTQHVQKQQDQASREKLMK